MIKQVLVYLLSFGLLSFLGYTLHTTLFSSIANESPISLSSLYIFFGGFSMMLCTLFLMLLKSRKLKDQLGFLYLVSVALKIATFCLVFSEAIFSRDSFTNTQSVNLLIPMFLMIALEVFFISKLLNGFSPSKNAE